MADLNPSNYVVPDYLTLTAMMNYIQGACVNAMKNFTVYAQRLMYLLAGIDLVAAVLLNLDEADHLKLLVKKVLKYGFFIFLIANYNSLLNTMLNGFMFFGKMVGSHTLQSVTEKIITNPAIIATYGLYLVKGALNVIIDQATSKVTSDPVVLMNLGILLCIAGSYFMVGLNLFLLYVEFYVLGALSIILVPFGVNQYTSFISQKVLNAMISIGIKMMVTVFIIGLVMPFMLTLQPLSLSAGAIKKGVSETNLQQNLYLLLPCLAMAFMAIQGPNLAMNLLSGGSSFNASAAVGSLAGAARMPETLSGWASKGFNPTNYSRDKSKVKYNNESTGILKPPPNVVGESQLAEYNNNLSAQSMANKYSPNSSNKS